MTVLVTGGDGQLGRALRALLPDAVFTDRELDVSDPAALEAHDWTGTTAIVNAAAWTAVDRAESEPLAAWQVNATGVALLALRARELDVPLVQVSTDYVLGGTHDGDAPVASVLDPQGVYGITKAAGEMAARLAPRHYVIRTSWVFGDGPNFVRTMRRLGATREEVRVVDDQVGRPTYAVDLAAALVGLLDGDLAPGTYHASGGGDAVSWAGFAAAVLEGTGCRVVPVSTADHLAGAAGPISPRPANSRLEPGLPMRPWREALADYLSQEPS